MKTLRISDGLSLPVDAVTDFAREPTMLCPSG